jgi:uncharacterized RDD family membrane protein YckC
MSDSTSTPPPDGSGSYPPPGSGQAPVGGYTPAPGYGYEPASSVGAPGELWSRFLARAIDNILVGIVGFVIAAIIDAIVGVANAGVGYTTGASYAANAVSGVIGAVVALAYFALLESRQGRTLGKMALGLRTEGPDGNPPTLEAAVRRNFWVALGILAVIPVVGGPISGLAELVIVIVIAVTIGRSPTKQGWHDDLAGGTRVVKTR